METYGWKCIAIDSTRGLIDRLRPRRAITGPEDVGTNDKVFVCIEELAGPQERAPPQVHARIAGQSVTNDDKIVFLSI